MEKIDAHLENRFQVTKAKSEAQRENWDRADVVIEVVKWLYLAEVMSMTAHLQPNKIISLMDHAKKHGEKPRSFFRYLVAEERKHMVEEKEKGQMPLV